MPAFSDSTAPVIGIDTMASQVSATMRERPLPSLPTTTTSGRSASSRPGSMTSPSPSRPSTKTPWSLNDLRVCVRFDAMATGMRAAAPAEVFHAEAVRPTERRCGMMTPWPPNAATERMIAPRLRGSVMPSSAPKSGFWRRLIEPSSRSTGCAYSYGGTLRATPWCTESGPVRRSSSGRMTSRIGSPRRVARLRISFVRSSISMRAAM
jgi:hypothetical protein